MATANAIVKPPASARLNLLGLDRAGMVAFCTETGEKPFRATQLIKWIHQQGVIDFDAMSNISKSFREYLKQHTTISPLTVVYDELSKDGTRKWVLELADGNQIEAVYIPEVDRGTLCVSSQVGCALDCSFCSTGRRGFNRNLSSAEIISQVWIASRLLLEEKKPGRSITNVVLMGMGEPLLNFDNMVTAVRIMMDDFAYGLSKRRVTVSTAGVVPAMDRLGDLLDSRLAVSLHATNDELRNELVPINKKYPLQELIAACHRFAEKQSARTRITFEYVMLDGVNDSPQQARELVRLLRGLPVMINLIPFNPFENSGYTTSPSERIEAFAKILIAAEMTTVVRRTRGDDIDAACGQLVGKVDDKSRRARRFAEPRFGMTS